MIIFIFLLGLCVGSFLNVLIDRLPKRKQVVKGRSSCDFCHKKLKFLDLVPLLSFLFLKGKCRYCHKKISLYYPLVELITGLLFLFIYFLRSPLLITNYLLLITNYLLLITITSCLIVIFFADLKYGVIPDEMIVLGILASFPLILSGVFSFNPVIPISRNPVINNLMVGILTSAFFFLLLVITKGKGMGFGDVKLAFLMGFLLGWPKIILAFYLSFLTGAVIGVILILIGKKKFGQTIPFGPFLAIGTGVSLFFGEQILKWWQLFL